MLSNRGSLRGRAPSGSDMGSLMAGVAGLRRRASSSAMGSLGADGSPHSQGGSFVVGSINHRKLGPGQAILGTGGGSLSGTGTGRFSGDVLGGGSSPSPMVVALGMSGVGLRPPSREATGTDSLLVGSRLEDVGMDVGAVGSLHPPGSGDGSSRRPTVLGGDGNATYAINVYDDNDDDDDDDGNAPPGQVERTLTSVSRLGSEGEIEDAWVATRGASSSSSSGRV